MLRADKPSAKTPNGDKFYDRTRKRNVLGANSSDSFLMSKVLLTVLSNRRSSLVISVQAVTSKSGHLSTSSDDK